MAKKPKPQPRTLRLPAGAKPTARQMETAERVYIGGRLVKDRDGPVPASRIPIGASPPPYGSRLKGAGKPTRRG